MRSATNPPDQGEEIYATAEESGEQPGEDWVEDFAAAGPAPPENPLLSAPSVEGSSDPLDRR